MEALKCLPTAISSGVDIAGVPRCHLLQQMSFQWGSQKLLWGLLSHELTAYPFVFELFLTHWIMGLLSKACTPGNFESDNSLKLGFTNIRGLCSNFFECESFLKSNTSHIFALLWDKLGWLNWFWHFLCDRLSSFNPILLLICTVLQFKWRKDFLLNRTNL